MGIVPRNLSLLDVSFDGLLYIVHPVIFQSVYRFLDKTILLGLELLKSEWLSFALDNLEQFGRQKTITLCFNLMQAHNHILFAADR